MNTQQDTLTTVYHKIHDHFIQQVVPSSKLIGEGDYPLLVCQYRGDDNTSCAAGCLILDQFYNRGLEGKTIDDERVSRALEYSLGLNPYEAWPKGIFDFIREAQMNIHDRVAHGAFGQDSDTGKQIQNLDHPRVLEELDRQYRIAMKYT